MNNASLRHLWSCQCTQLEFTSFLSGGFTIAGHVKLINLRSVQWSEPSESGVQVEENKSCFNELKFCEVSENPKSSIC